MRTILVVEDDETVRKLLRTSLERAGYRVLEAPDGRSARHHMERGSPDLIVQDLVLPDLDGFTLVLQLRKLPGGSRIPIIALSGLLGRVDQARDLSSGFTDYLSKPVSPAHLLRVIGWYLPKAGPPREKQGAIRRVLLVDDDPIQLRLVKRVFDRAGFEVITASDGPEALEAARQAPPDAIVSDLLMPGLDGFRLCLALQLDPQLASIPVVLTSGISDSAQDLKRALEVGAQALIPRTSDYQAVLDAVVTSLADRSHPATKPTGVVSPTSGASLPTPAVEARGKPEATFRLTPHGSLVTANPTLAQLLGYVDPEQLIAAHPDFREIFVDPERGDDFLHRAAEPKGVLAFEAEARRLDGRIISIQARGAALRDEDGIPCLLEGAIEDLSKREDAE